MKTIAAGLGEAGAPRVVASTSADFPRDEEASRASMYPISRWYARPWANGLARLLAPTFVRPAHLTMLGLLSSCGAIGALTVGSGPVLAAGALVWLAWFFDRADGQLARLQGTASRFGAWMDANVDEFTDVALHVATAFTAARLTGQDWPWLLLVAFLAGKYLLMHGLQMSQALEKQTIGSRQPGTIPAKLSWPRICYHLPANSDVRLHLLLVALLGSAWNIHCLSVELAVLALYYNLRWPLRYGLLYQRLS